ncbi:MAG: tetratricopeptide repeat protein [Balneolaceae bacterium]
MKKSTLYLLFAFFISSVALPQQADGQARDYQLANRLMQQQKFDEALPLLESLYQQHPQTFVFFDRLTETMVRLERTSDAIELSEHHLASYPAQPAYSIRLAELYHMDGQRQQALDTWHAVLQQEAANMQIIYNVGSSMSDRREYLEAAEVFEQARERFGDQQLFKTELASNYMQAGLFEKAVRQFYEIVEASPDQMSQVQQQFLRMRDPQLYEIAALELEDFLLELDYQHPAYAQLYQLLSWILLENEEFRRAFVFARQYESRTGMLNYSLYSLAARLQSARQFELARDAYGYYVESNSSIKQRAMEEIARTNLLWARYLQENSLGSGPQRDSLITEAYELNSRLLNEGRLGNRESRILEMQTELALDYFKNRDMAEQWVQRMKQRPEEATTYYAEGRLALFDGDHVMARQAFSRADRQSQESAFSDKVRFFLSLNDFIAGDFEFADVQLRSLERRHSSLYANDAIQLKLWINTGKHVDGNKDVLHTLGDAIYNLKRGHYGDAMALLKPVVESRFHPFADIFTVELIKELPKSHLPYLYGLVEHRLKNASQSPLKERLMWEKAQLAEQLRLTDWNDIEAHYFDETPPDIPSAELIEQFYEDVLIEFPQGFYAEFSRAKLQQSQAPTI